ncbi:MAG: hypothetical protein KDB48_02065 [Solirubrobacterales bacterium]|nr:hypothetical protein [Solirubrobacterales bacterium]HMT05372.1 hypothetical protein [Solirubrobacterales bacterium]
MSFSREALAKLKSAGRSDGPPTWVLGVLVALLAWAPTFALPAPGLDVSWWSGLYMAARDQLQFGQEIVFTYGPLGFMKLPWLFYPGLSLISYLYVSLLFIAYCVSLVWILRRSLSWIPTFLISLLIVAILPGVEQSVALALFASMAVVAKRPDDRHLLIYAAVGGVWAAAEALMKLSIGPLAVVLLLVGLIGAGPRRVHIATFAGALAGGSLFFWLIAGQSLEAVPDFLINAARVTLGYSEGMALDTSGWKQPVLLAAIVAGSVLWAWFGEFPNRRARIAAVAIAFLVAFTSYKQGVVRADASHVTIFLATIALLWIAVPVRRALLPVSLAGIALFSFFAIREIDSPVRDRLDPVSNVKRFIDGGRIIFEKDARKNLADMYRFYSVLSYALEPELLERLEGRGVSVEPWEAEVVWAYGLDWSPVPVFQNYAAYSPALDDLNATSIASPEGPERILREGNGGSIDNRLIAWDAPAQAVATLCHFHPIASQERWQLLGRIPNRCGEQLPAGTAEASEGETVPVPVPGPDEVVLVRIEGAEVSGVEKIRSLLFRPRVRHIENSAGAFIHFIPAVASQGLMLDAGRRLRAHEGHTSPIPATRTIAVFGAGDDLRFEFFRMKVKQK